MSDSAPIVILRRPEVQRRTGLSAAAIYARMDPSAPEYLPDFPTPISLGARAVGWIEAELNAWLQKQIEVSRQTDGRLHSVPWDKGGRSRVSPAEKFGKKAKNAGA